MSLRDLGVFRPLGADHPIIGKQCWICDATFGVGSRTALRPFETAEQAGGLNCEARPICGTCALRGTEIGTPAGRRIVDRIKDGDGSPFAVITTDNHEWKEDEVEP